MKKLILDGERILNREMLHDMLAEGLDLPEYYGRNLDALFDCLTDIQEDTKILLCHKDAMGANMKGYAVSLAKVLCEASEANPHIQLETLDE